MSERKHTAGPWFVFENGHCVGGPFEPGPDDDHGHDVAGVAMCGMRMRTNEEAEANARLIAASPRMLDAIEATLLFHGSRGEEDRRRWRELTGRIACDTRTLCEFLREVQAEAKGAG